MILKVDGYVILLTVNNGRKDFIIYFTIFQISVKQCCRRLNGYKDENVETITKPFNSMPSLYNLEGLSRVEKVISDYKIWILVYVVLISKRD